MTKQYQYGHWQTMNIGCYSLLSISNLAKIHSVLILFIFIDLQCSQYIWIVFLIRLHISIIRKCFTPSFICNIFIGIITDSIIFIEYKWVKNKIGPCISWYFSHMKWIHFSLDLRVPAVFVAYDLNARSHHHWICYFYQLSSMFFIG